MPKQIKTGAIRSALILIFHCSTQRRLSVVGKADAKLIGEGIKTAGIPVGDVISSGIAAYITAELAFGRHTKIRSELPSCVECTPEDYQKYSDRPHLYSRKFRRMVNTFLVGHDDPFKAWRWPLSSQRDLSCTDGRCLCRATNGWRTIWIDSQDPANRVATIGRTLIFAPNAEQAGHHGASLGCMHGFYSIKFSWRQLSVQRWQSLRSPMERYLVFWSRFNLIDRWTKTNWQSWNVAQRAMWQSETVISCLLKTEREIAAVERGSVLLIEEYLTEKERSFKVLCEFRSFVWPLSGVLFAILCARPYPFDITITTLECILIDVWLPTWTYWLWGLVVLFALSAQLSLTLPVERFIFHVLNPLKHRFVVHPVVEPFHPWYQAISLPFSSSVGNSAMRV